VHMISGTCFMRPLHLIRIWEPGICPRILI
jgi:hypothetical protein